MVLEVILEFILELSLNFAYTLKIKDLLSLFFMHSLANVHQDEFIHLLCV